MNAVTQPSVEINDLSVKFGRNEVLHSVNLSIGHGEVVALLGPNGAGKTTLVDCLEGFRKPTSGHTCVLGTDPWRAPRAWRDRIGVVLQDTRLDTDLTVEEFATMTAGWYSDPGDIHVALRRVGLSRVMDRRVYKLSGGERRRLDLAMALIANPELIFLDEPTTGLDPDAKREIWAILNDLRARGVTVLMTSHDLQEVEALADRVIILINGRVLLDGTPESIRQEAQEAQTLSFVTGSQDRARSVLNADLDEQTGRMSMEAPDVSAAVTRVNHTLGQDVLDVQVHTPSFEDVYLGLLKHSREQSADRGERK